MAAFGYEGLKGVRLVIFNAQNNNRDEDKLNRIFDWARSNNMRVDPKTFDVTFGLSIFHLLENNYNVERTLKQSLYTGQELFKINQEMLYSSK